MEDRVRIEIADGIADVRLNRPDKLNAMDKAMFAALGDAGKALAEDRSVRAVVLSGEGRGFCSGLDLASLMADLSKAQELLAPTPDSPANFVQRAAWIWRELPVPVIAAVHGVAYGGGLQVAMGADIRVVAPDARLCLSEVHWGLVPDIGITQSMRDVLPLDLARELSYTGREVAGEEAVALRLATHVDPDPRGRAMAIAGEIAHRCPDAVRAAKRLWNEAPLAATDEGLELEGRLQARLIGSPNQQEAVMARMAKRAPKFNDPVD